MTSRAKREMRSSRMNEAITDFKKMIADYQWDDPKERDMVNMYTQDRKDFRVVLKLFKGYNFDEAMSKAHHMDTAARECIPDSVWEILEVMSHG
jgi:hypothetical protein